MLSEQEDTPETCHHNIGCSEPVCFKLECGARCSIPLLLSVSGNIWHFRNITGRVWTYSVIWNTILILVMNPKQKMRHDMRTRNTSRLRKISEVTSRHTWLKNHSSRFRESSSTAKSGLSALTVGLYVPLSHPTFSRFPGARPIGPNWLQKNKSLHSQGSRLKWFLTSSYGRVS